MGFYGNVSSSNKTAFSFDITYSSRTLMDTNAQTDGVFIGRYVLVEYDAPPISAYYKTDDRMFYNVSYSGGDNLISRPKDGQIYLDISQDHSANPFYVWRDNAEPSTTIYAYKVGDTTHTTTHPDDPEHYTYEVIAVGAYVKVEPNATPYTTSYNIDVSNYGRGYDSTAWRKTYDVETNKYKYVLVSELNTVVPNFHLIVDPPSSVPVAPYFDRDTTTNLDYFLHDQADWGVSVRSANKVQTNYTNRQTGELVAVQDQINLSDEYISRVLRTWSEPDAFGNQTLSELRSPGGEITHEDGDIYYNKKGFSREYRHMTPQQDGKSTITNTINYEIDHSGRLYYDTINMDGTRENGTTRPDVMEWYVHLPILGDAICELWDTLYNYDHSVNQNDTHILNDNEVPIRYTDLATRRGDDGVDIETNGESVLKRHISYSPDSALGAINEMRDMLGYTIKSLVDIEPNLTKIDDDVTTVAQAVQDGDENALKIAIDNIAKSFNKEDTKYLYYTLKKDTDPQQLVKEHFFAYTYSPQFIQVHYDETKNVWYYHTDNNDPLSTKVEFAEADLYYLDTDNVYKKVNRSNHGITLSNNQTVEPIATFYAPFDSWKLTEVDNIKEDSVYGLITRLHELLGDTNPTLRTMDTIAGCINILKDMISNVDSQLQPHRLLMTNDHGQIVNMQEYDGDNFGNTVEYPYFASVDNQETLDCGGHWRLPVTYKLQTFNLIKNGKYFNKYWGNSTYHELKATDTIGDAFDKVSEELSDIQYKSAKRIKSFIPNAEVAKQGASITCSYIIDGKTSWQRVYYKVNNVDTDLISSRSNSAYLEQNASDVSGSFEIKDMPNTDLTITLYVVDERGNKETESITVKHALTYQYDVNSNLLNATEGLLKDTVNSFKVTVDNNQYLYIKVPSADYRLFIDNQYGGFDLFDAQQHIYRTTNTSLGTIEVEIYE